MCGIETFKSDPPYDFIVSGLPFANFSAPFVDQLLNAMFGLLAPRGQLTYFEYMYMRSMRKIGVGLKRESRPAKFGSRLEWILSTPALHLPGSVLAQFPTGLGAALGKKIESADRRGRMTSDIPADILPCLALIGATMAVPQIKPGETKVGWIGTGVMGS